MSPSPTPPARDSSGSVSLHLPEHLNHNHRSSPGGAVSSIQVYILKGEISLLLCSLRRISQQRWSSHQQDPKSDYPLLKQLQTLKESLESESRLCVLRMAKDANYFLVPFLDVIRSEDTSGPITVLALNAVEKFISHELVHESNGGTAAVEAITDAVIHAHFVSSDSASDELVLMKILQVLHRLFISPVGSLLSNEAVCELMQSCLRMCFIERANELLKKSAETALHDMVRVLFMRVKEFPIVFGKKMKSADSSSHLAIEVSEDSSPKHAPVDRVRVVTPETNLGTNEEPNSVDQSTNPLVIEPPQTPQIIESKAVAIDIDVESLDGQLLSATADTEVHTTPEPPPVPVIHIEHPTPTQDTTPRNPNPNIVEFKNKRGIKFTNASSNVSSEIPEEDEIEPVKSEVEEEPTHKLNSPFGIPCVRELLRFLVSLINPHEKQNTEMMVHLGLKLLLVAVESDMEGISKHPQLSNIVKNEFVKNLIALLSWQNTNTVILLNVLRILFIIFETMRSAMKYQLEVFLAKMMELIGDGQQVQGPAPSQNQPQPLWNFEQRDIALDYLIQLWKLPTVVTELYLNYDCDLFCTNLFEDLTKLLSKNAFPLQSGINSIHLHCLDGLVSILDGVEAHCTNRLSSTNISASSDESNSSVFYHEYEPNEIRFEKCDESDVLPTHEQLMAVRHKKKILHTGCEQFNQHAGKGIIFLQSQGLLSSPLDSSEVAQFLRDNPLLDKKTIGDYVSTKKNHEVLKGFVKSFDFLNTRIDEALRQFLETFRLPGEAPLISHILEEFSEHWFQSNNAPFANVDAAFTLSYAVIMLNVDQHNTNVKKNSNSMTLDEFRKNLKGVNGGQDFNQNMLQMIYTTIKSDEIVMPAEQTGMVKENYMWKVLLRRGAASKYICPTSDEGLYDHDLFSLSWGPIVAALSFIFDKTFDNLIIITKSLNGFKKCATISAHYGMSDVFDNLVISLCKFTTLLSGNSELGSSIKAQSACRTVFQLVHRHGGILREGWHNFIDCLIALFKSQSLPKILTESEDFTEPSGRCSLIRGSQVSTPRVETGFLSSFYSYIALTSSDSSLGNKSTIDEEDLKKKTANVIRECQPELLLSESKFLPLDSLNELVKNLIYTSPVPENSRRKDYDEDSIVFVLEVLIKISIQNRDRVMVFWDPLREHIFSMIYAAASCDMPYLLERATVGLLRLALRLMRKEDLCAIVLQSLKILLYLRPAYVMQLSQQMSFGLHEILKTTAANIHTTEEWTIIFALLEYVGSGRVPSGNASNQPTVNPQALMSSSGSDPTLNEMDKPPGLQHSLSQDPITATNGQVGYSSGSDRGYTSDSELEIKSQNSAEARLSSVSPAQSWILLTHNTMEDTASSVNNSLTSPTRSPKITPQERQVNFIPDPRALLKSCETLSFLVRDAAHITPDNFTLCVGAIRSFVDACSVRIQGSKTRDASNRKQKRGKRYNSPEHSIPKSRTLPKVASAYDADYESDPEADQIAANNQCSIQLLDLLHTLHTRASQIFQWWQKENETATPESLWTLGWKPLLQTIGVLCCDSRKQVRTTALTYLQRALLVHDLQQLAPSEWCSCFDEVLFPLMARLLEPINPLDPQGMEETRMRAATLLCKVFLQHLTPLMGLEGFCSLWMEILSVMERYMKCDQKCELLTEAIPESLKNLLLVMDTAGVFHTPDGYTKLWVLTWEKIDSFLPNLRVEMFAAVQVAANNPSNSNANAITVIVPGAPTSPTASVPTEAGIPNVNVPPPPQSTQVQSPPQHTEVILDA